MIIRLAEKGDLPELVEIYNQAIDAKSTAVLERVSLEERLTWFQGHPRDAYPIRVAESGEGVVGFLYLSAYRPGRTALRHTAEVSCFVHSDHHRQGIASALMLDCLEKCVKLEIKNLFAILLESNLASISLLKKFGFKEWAHLPEVAKIDGKPVGQVYLGRKV